MCFMHNMSIHVCMKAFAAEAEACAPQDKIKYKHTLILFTSRWPPMKTWTRIHPAWLPVFSIDLSVTTSVYIYPHWSTLSSWESGCSRLCCWIAIGGGRGTASAPSSPSSSPQLCMPDEEDLESVPLLSPSLRIRCREKKNGDYEMVGQKEYKSNGELLLLPLVFHPVAWRHCRQSPSASLALGPCSSLCHHGSSCACGRASWRGHLLCRSWVSVRGWSATSSRCSLDAWVPVSYEDPGFGWSLAARCHCWIQTRCLKVKGRREKKGSLH